MSEKQCERFKCIYEPVAPDCGHCQFDPICPYSGTCSACLFGIASDFIGCPEKPLTNFSRVSARENNEKAYMDKIRLDKGIEGGL